MSNNNDNKSIRELELQEQFENISTLENNKEKENDQDDEDGPNSVRVHIRMDSTQSITPRELLGMVENMDDNSDEYTQVPTVDGLFGPSAPQERELRHRRSTSVSTSTCSRYSSGGSNKSEKPWYLSRVTSIAAYLNRRLHGRSSELVESDNESYEDEERDCSIQSTDEWSRRIIPRDYGYCQSSGVISIEQTSSTSTFSELLSLYSNDWFHRTLIQRFWLLLLLIFVIHTIFVLFLAAIYYGVNDPDPVSRCCLFTEEGMNNTRRLFFTAFAFALESSVTTGYGLPGFANDTTPLAFWMDCPRMPVLVWIQFCLRTVFYAILFALVIARCGRATTRARRVVFSNKACITHINGKFYFAYQVYDLEIGRPTVEASTRAYVVFNTSDGNLRTNFQTRIMRMQNPDDNLGSDLFLSTPCVAVHHIDQWSPLLPPTMRREHWQSHNDNFVHNPANRYLYPHMALREVDALAGYRESVSCPVCGEAFATDEHLFRHMRYAQYVENLDDSSTCSGSSSGYDEDEEEDDNENENENNENENGEVVKDVDPSLAHGRETESNSVPDAVRANSSSIKASISRRSRRSTAFSANTNASRRKSIASARSRYASKSLEWDEKKGRRHKFIKSGGKSTVDSHLKSCGKLERATGHKGIPLEVLTTKYHIVSDDRDMSSDKQGISSRISMSVNNYRDRIRNFVEASQLEVIVLVEGIEPHSSDTFQARHSYTGDEIMFDHWFVPCMYSDGNEMPVIDLDKFHETYNVNVESGNTFTVNQSVL